MTNGVVVFEVGEGDGIALVTRSGHAVVIDAGRSGANGERIAQFLESEAENGVDLKKEKRRKKKGLDTIRLEPTPDFSMPRRQAAARPHVSLPSDSTPTRPDPKEARRRLEAAIQQLEGRCQRCMYLREIEGLSYEHIAEKMGIPLGSVSNYLTQGRKQVRDIVRNEQDRQK